jgi:hypothetical protein
MTAIARELNTKIEVRDASQIITSNQIVIHNFPDDRGFSFITCKVYDESVEQPLRDIMKQFNVKE